MYEIVDISQDEAKVWVVRVSIRGSTQLLRFQEEPTMDVIQSEAARCEVMLTPVVEDVIVEEQADGAPIIV